jgi:hypothetical protein
MSIGESDVEPVAYDEKPEDVPPPKTETGKTGPYSLRSAQKKLAGFWDGRRHG